jgi:hypothetical protein
LTTISAAHHDTVKWQNLDTDHAHHLSFTPASGVPVEAWLYPYHSGKPDSFTWVGVTDADAGKLINYRCTLDTGEADVFYVGN